VGKVWIVCTLPDIDEEGVIVSVVFDHEPTDVEVRACVGGRDLLRINVGGYSLDERDVL
jgi:hypothetical protein